VNGDVGTQAREPFGECAAKSTAGACDQRNLTLQRPGGVVCRHDVSPDVKGQSASVAGRTRLNRLCNPAGLRS